jgi:hypothetical protein
MSSTRRSLSWALLFILITAIALPSLASAKKKRFESELEGTWFLVIHFTDENTNNPDSTRWLDRVWRFSMKGSRLLWTEYPIVVIEDTTGRFEAIPGNPRSRVLEGWEPNSAQYQDLKAGPRVNTRGSKSKSLKGSDTKGWKSTGRNNVASASVVGYQENWSILGAAGKRVFAFDEIFGNAAKGSAEGQTIYSEVEIKSDGSEVRGKYERDGTRIGTFRMFRTKNIRALKSESEDSTVNERAGKRNAEKFMENMRKEELERQRSGDR